jgi:hypothetical protein
MRHKLQEGRLSVRGVAISGGRRTLRRSKPRKGEGLGPGSSVSKSLEEKKAKRGALAWEG